jgi:hypothetical protein
MSKNMFDQTTKGSESKEMICKRYATPENHINKKFSHKIKQFKLSRIKKNRAH